LEEKMNFLNNHPRIASLMIGTILIAISALLIPTAASYFIFLTFAFTLMAPDIRNLFVFCLSMSVARFSLVALFVGIALGFWSSLASILVILFAVSYPVFYSFDLNSIKYTVMAIMAARRK